MDDKIELKREMGHTETLTFVITQLDGVAVVTAVLNGKTETRMIDKNESIASWFGQMLGEC